MFELIIIIIIKPLYSYNNNKTKRISWINHLYKNIQNIF